MCSSLSFLISFIFFPIQCIIFRYCFHYVYCTKILLPLHILYCLFSSFLYSPTFLFVLKYLFHQPTNISDFPCVLLPSGYFDLLIVITFLYLICSILGFLSFQSVYTALIFCSLFFSFLWSYLYSLLSLSLNNLKFSLHHETILSYRISLFFLSAKVNAYTHFSVFADMFNNSACMTIIVTKSEVYSFPDFSSARTQTFERIVQFSLKSLPVIFVRAARVSLEISPFARDLGRSQAAGTCSRVRM